MSHHHQRDPDRLALHAVSRVLDEALPTDSSDHAPRDTLHEERPTPHAHAFAHANDHDKRANGPAAVGASFAHERLDAYRVALQMARAAKNVAREIPRGHRNVADHLLRSAANTVLLLAEGANRRTHAEKRQRFGESRGEAAEVAAAADLVLVLERADQTQATALQSYAGRVSAMLTRLIARLPSLTRTRARPLVTVGRGRARARMRARDACLVGRVSWACLVKHCGRR